MSEQEAGDPEKAEEVLWQVVCCGHVLGTNDEATVRASYERLHRPGHTPTLLRGVIEWEVADG